MQMWCLQAEYQLTSAHAPNAIVMLQVMMHPRFGTASYPATLFTKAPLSVLRVVIEEVEAEATDTGYYQEFMTI